MNNELITFTTARLAKEAGFNEAVDHFYIEDYPDLGIQSNGELRDFTEVTSDEQQYMNAPTKYALQSWLRERDIEVWVIPLVEYDIEIKPHTAAMYYDFSIMVEKHPVYIKDNIQPTYHEAFEESLQLALKYLIGISNDSNT